MVKKSLPPSFRCVRQADYRGRLRLHLPAGLQEVQQHPLPRYHGLAAANSRRPNSVFLSFFCFSLVLRTDPNPSRRCRHQWVHHPGHLPERGLSEHTGQLQVLLQGRFSAGAEPLCGCVPPLPLLLAQLLLFLKDSLGSSYSSTLLLWSRSRVSSRIRPVLPYGDQRPGLRAAAVGQPHPGGVLLHGGQSLGPQLWAMSTAGHRWVMGCSRLSNCYFSNRDWKMFHSWTIIIEIFKVTCCPNCTCTISYKNMIAFVNRSILC